MTRTKQEQGKFAKRKGSNYERDIARKISKLTGQIWRRTPYSGAGHISGDIFRISPSPFPIIIELKNRVDITLDRIFRNPDFIQEFVNEKQILIFNNRGQDIVIAPYATSFVSSMKVWGVIESDDMAYVIMDLKDFAKIIGEFENV